jgi:hypothetical protein
MQIYKEGSPRRLYVRVTVTGMFYRRQKPRARALFTDAAIPEKKASWTNYPIIVNCLDYRYSIILTRIIARRGNERKDIMEVHNFRFKPRNDLTYVPIRLG